ncbi:dipeptide transport system permease protein [Rhizobium aquaticum]|uniref:Dipeptide transport system permease protein n=1 Tax=Rhizobium aquaticum TaxID=1549636 RepID=A0ABV2J3F8_9HYPH
MAEATNNAVKPQSALGEFWYYFTRSKGAVIGLAVFVIVVLMAIFAPLIAPHLPNEQDRAILLLPPSWMQGGNASYLLGTDPVGRDIFSRLVYGARFSLFIGVVVVSLSVVLGVVIGLIAGFAGGKTDIVIMRVMDIVLAFPSLLLALVLVAVLGPGLMNAMMAIALVNLPHFVRLTRASVMTEKTKEYVIGSRVAGARWPRLMFITILPNCLAPLIVQATLAFSAAILDAAALGFLGMGAQPPTPEWGTMLAEAREFISRAWWVVTFPGLAILITVLAINLMGDGLRDALDPKLKRS